MVVSSWRADSAICVWLVANNEAESWRFSVARSTASFAVSTAPIIASPNSGTRLATTSKTNWLRSVVSGFSRPTPARLDLSKRNSDMTFETTQCAIYRPSCHQPLVMRQSCKKKRWMRPVTVGRAAWRVKSPLKTFVDAQPVGLQTVELFSEFAKINGFADEAVGAALVAGQYV